MVEDLLGTVSVNCLAFIENPRVVPDDLVDFHIFDATIRCFAVGHDDPFVFCSLSYKDHLGRDPLCSGVYQIEATVNFRLLVQCELFILYTGCRISSLRSPGQPNVLTPNIRTYGRSHKGFLIIAYR